MTNNKFYYVKFNNWVNEFFQYDSYYYFISKDAMEKYIKHFNEDLKIIHDSMRIIDYGETTVGKNGMIIEK